MIYLDNNATTAMDPAVLQAMFPVMESYVGNPSSIHRFGQAAKALIIESTRVCARYFGVTADEIVFTSGATEGLNFLIHNLPTESHVITSSLEHSAVLEPLKVSGCSVTYLTPEEGQGAITAQQIQDALQEKTAAIILTSANNETGVITTALEEIASFATQAGIHVIVDGVAHLGKGFHSLPKGVVAACFSGHKIHGPTGVGVTVVRKAFKPQPLLLGGSQQRGLRAGTENVAAIVGLAKALQLLQENESQWMGQIEHRRNLFEQILLEKLPDILIHNRHEQRVCNTTNIAFQGVDGETLVMALDLAGVAASHGSACSSGTLESSRVLLNMGVSPKIARSSLRFSLSRFTTEEEILQSTSLIIRTVSHLRTL